MNDSWTKVQTPDAGQNLGDGTSVPEEFENKNWTKVQTPDTGQNLGVGTLVPKELEKNWTKVQAPNDEQNFWGWDFSPTNDNKK